MSYPQFASLPKFARRATLRRYLSSLVFLVAIGLLANLSARWWRATAQAQSLLTRQVRSGHEDLARHDVRLMEFAAATVESAGPAIANRRAVMGVTLHWRTGYEADNLGFNVYRDEAGIRVRINPTLIAGSALFTGGNGVLTAGQSYTWHDRQGVVGSGYWLEVVALSGATRWHGPVYVVSNENGAVRAFNENDQVNARLLDDLNDDIKPDTQREWANADEAERFLGQALHGEVGGWQAMEVGQRLPAPATTNTSAWVTVPNEKAAKLAVTKTGWYRVTAAELTASGFNPNVNPALLQLYADGYEVPLKTTGKGNRVDSIEFYGRGNDLPATNTRIYWLVTNTLNVGGALRVEECKAKEPSSFNATSFVSTIERKDRSIYFSGLFNGDAENWFGPVVSNSAIVQTVTTKSVNRSAAEPAQLELTLQGVTAQAHTVIVEINGQGTEPINFIGQARHVATFNLSVRTLLEGINEIRLFSIAGGSDISLIESVRLRYPRRYIAESDVLSFSLPEGRAAFINGFTTPNIRVFEVGGPVAGARELLVNVQRSGTGFGFAFQGEAGGSYLALAENRLEPVAGVTLNQPSNWRALTNAADFIIVTHRNFRAAAERLAALRRASELRVAVVDVEDAYDEFTYGTCKPEAIKALLTHARTNWLRKPKYVLFIGDATHDPRNYLGLGNFDFVPTKLGQTFFFETALDNWFVDADGDNLPELALGRLPVRTAAQADALIAKIISFRPTAAPRGALLVSDRAQPGLDFRAENERLAALLPASMTKQFIGRDDGAPGQVRELIINRVNQTMPLLVNWLGHGSTQVWTGDGLLRSQDAPVLTNTAKSLFVMTTCLNGYFTDPTQTGLSEAVLVDSPGGAFGTVGTSALIFPEPALLFNQALFRALFAESKTLGEAMTAARVASGDADVRNSFVLFGDPTMRVR